MNRKHSYREIKKRNFAKNVLFCLEDMEDAKTADKYYSDKKYLQEFVAARNYAQNLIDDFKAGRQIFINHLSPCINEIRTQLQRIKSGQTTLFI